jgi:hypothetical protein
MRKIVPPSEGNIKNRGSSRLSFTLKILSALVLCAGLMIDPLEKSMVGMFAMLFVSVAFLFGAAYVDRNNKPVRFENVIYVDKKKIDTDEI